MSKESQLVIKRIIDIIGSFLCLIILCPLLLIVAILIKLDSKGPVLYIQERVGYKGKLFKIYKFRTMVDKAEFMGSGLYMDGDDDPRITKVGKFLRKTSIDELPQLVNVLKGDMSLVGPRPLLNDTINNMYEYQRKRLLMRPGITGYAQVCGRIELNYRERVEKDLQYINSYSLLFDFRILLKTIKVVLSREGNDASLTKEELEEY